MSINRALVELAAVQHLGKEGTRLLGEAVADLAAINNTATTEEVVAKLEKILGGNVTRRDAAHLRAAITDLRATDDPGEIPAPPPEDPPSPDTGEPPVESGTIVTPPGVTFSAGDLTDQDPDGHLGIEKTELQPIIDAYVFGQRLNEYWLRRCWKQIADGNAPLNGNAGGGSVNHVGMRLGAAMVFIRLYPGQVTAEQTARVRSLSVDFLDSQLKTGHKVFGKRDESGAPTYSDYDGGAVCGIALMASQLGWSDVERAARDWLKRDVAYVGKCYFNGTYWTAGRRGHPGRKGNPSVARAFESLTTGKITSRVQFLNQKNDSGCFGNRYALYSSILVLSGVWKPEPGSNDLMDMPPVAADRWHIITGTQAGHPYYANFVDRYSVLSNDTTTWGIFVRAGEDDGVHWFTESGGLTPPPPPAGWPGRFEGVHLHISGGLDGWRREVAP